MSRIKPANSTQKPAPEGTDDEGNTWGLLAVALQIDWAAQDAARVPELFRQENTD
jgi:hypothetical protein